MQPADTIEDTAAETTVQEKIDDLLYHLEYKCDLGVRYHKKRSRFLSVCEKWAKVVSLLSGMACFQQVFPELVRTCLGVAVVGALLVSIVFNLADKAKLHEKLAAKYNLLLAEIEELGNSISEKEIFLKRKQLRTIEMEEPPELGILVRICQNQIAEAGNRMEYVYPVPWFQRVTAQLINWNSPLDRRDDS